MEVNEEKSKIMSNITKNLSADISMNNQKLEEVTIFKYLAATLCEDDICRPARQKCAPDCLGNSQTKQDLAVQHHQLRKQV